MRTTIAVILNVIISMRLTQKVSFFVYKDSI